MINKPVKNDMRKKRHLRLRNKIVGTAGCPRLNVFRSSKNIYAQLIDDAQGVTLVSASTLDSALKAQESATAVETAHNVGQLLAQRAVDKGFAKVVFDRGGYIYHGQVKALAEGAREGGLNF